MNAPCWRSTKPCSPTGLLLPNQSKTNRCRCRWGNLWIWWRTRSRRALAGSWVDLIKEVREPQGQALTSHHTVWTNQWTKATMVLFSKWWCSSNNNRWWCLTMGSCHSRTPSRWRSNLLVWQMLTLTTTSSRTLCFQQSLKCPNQLAQAVTIENTNLSLTHPHTSFRMHKSRD